MQSLAAELLALAVYAPLVVLWHELGHVALARAGGYRVTRFSIGLGPPLLRLGTVGGAAVDLGAGLVLGGACTAIPVGPPGRRRLWFHLGGLVAQAALALALWALADLWWAERAARFNGLVALTNALPWAVRGAASDGWHALDLLRGGRRETEILPQRQALRRALRRAEAARAPLGIAWARLCLAWCDVVGGRPARAAPFFDDPPGDVFREPWLIALAAFVEAEWHRELERPLAALHAARVARATLGDGASEAAAALVALGEAGALIDLGEVDAARRGLAAVVGADGVVARQALALLLLASLDDGPDAVEFAAWRVVRRADAPWLDPIAAALALWAAADALEAAGRRADGLRASARGLGARTLAGLAAEDEAAVKARLGPVAAWAPAAREAPGR